MLLGLLVATEQRNNMSLALNACDGMNDSAGAVPRVLAVEIEHLGHHPSYVRNFAKTWVEYQVNGQLKFLVTARFMRAHQDEVEFVRSLGEHGLSIEPLACQLPDRDGPRRVSDYWTAWKAFCDRAKDWKANHGLLMYSDFFQLPVCFGKESPCSLSAIYFRPTFHYSELPDYHPRLTTKLKSMRKAWLMKRFLRVPQVERVFSLDPLAVGYMNNHMRHGGKVEFLPDTFARFSNCQAEIDEIRAGLEVQEGRKLLMLIGILDRRKGIVELLEACRRLPGDIAKSICLVFVGKLADELRDQVTDMIVQLNRENSVQIILRDEFISESEVQLYYGAADVILATYQNHMGSSSALIRAALAGKPILASRYGLLGELVRRRKLGRTVDCSDATALREGLASCLGDWEGDFQPEIARQFYEENTPARLAECLRKLAGGNLREGVQPAAGRNVFQHS